MDEATAAGWSELDTVLQTKTLALTTFRRSGVGVTTGIWAARIGDRYFFTTPASTGKVKRLAHTPKVIIEPADSKGKPIGGTQVTANAYLVTDQEALDTFRRAMKRKGAIMSRVIEIFYVVKRDTRLLYELRRQDG
jgi:uncharacterized protein